MRRNPSSFNRGRCIRRRTKHRPQNGIERLEPRHLLAAGDLDLTFGDLDTVTGNPSGILKSDLGGDERFADLVVSGDGSIIAAGTQSSLLTASIPLVVAKYSSTGERVSSAAPGTAGFGIDGKYELFLEPFGLQLQEVTGVALQGDKILVTGWGTDTTAGDFRSFVVRLEADGARDDSFDTDGFLKFEFNGSLGDSRANDIAYSSTAGRIFVGGTSFDTTHMNRDFALVAITEAGGIDTTFGNAGTALVDFQGIPDSIDIGGMGSYESLNRILVQPVEGSILLAGSIDNPNFFPGGAAIARVTVSGLLDNSFGSLDGPVVRSGRVIANVTATGASIKSAEGIALHNGGIVIAAAGIEGMVAFRQNINGTVDTEFGDSGFRDFFVDRGDARDIAVQTNGAIVLTGFGHDPVEGKPSLITARFNANGSNDPGWGTGGIVYTKDVSEEWNVFPRMSLLIQPDGKILVGGDSAGRASSDLLFVRLLGDPVNSPPVANDDFYFVQEDTPRDLHDGGIPFWGNDTDAEGDFPLVAQILSGPAFGTLTSTGTGIDTVYNYAPALNFFGEDLITYQVTDSRGAVSNVATITLTVLALNDPPIAIDVPENTQDVIPLKSLFPAGMPITFELFRSGSSDYFEIIGDVLRFKAPPDFENPNGIEGTNTYEVLVGLNNNGNTDGQAFQVHVLNVNESPTDLVLSGTEIDENVPINTVVGTFGTTDPDGGDTHNYTLVSGAGDTDNTSFVVTGSQLTISVSPNFETKANYSIHVRTTDAAGLSFEKPFTITVNDIVEGIAPIIAGPTAITTDEDTQFSLIGFAITDPDSTAITVTLAANGTLSPALFSGTPGEVTDQLNRVTYLPPLDSTAPDTIIITVSDGTSSTSHTVNVAIQPVNDPPTIVVPDVQSFLTEIDNRFTSLPNPFRISDIDALDANVQVDLTIADGSLTIVDATGVTVSQNPGGNNGLRLTGSVTNINTSLERGVDYRVATAANRTLTATVSDLGNTGSGNVLTASAIVNLTTQRYVPSSVSGTVWVDETQEGRIDDAELRVGGVKVVLSGAGLGSTGNLSRITSADGTYSFDNLPPGSYQVSSATPVDLIQADVPRSYDVNIAAPGGDAARSYNFGTIGLEASLARTLDQLASRYVLGNPGLAYNGMYAAVAADNSPLWFALLDGYENIAFVEVVLAANKAVVTVVDRELNVFSADLTKGRFFGVLDGTGNTIIRILGDRASLPFALVNLTAPPAKNAPKYLDSVRAYLEQLQSTSSTFPIANKQELSTTKDVPVNITLSGKDPQNRPLQSRIFSGPSNGELTGVAPNLTYTPRADFTGADRFTFLVDNGINNSVPATVLINVKNANKPPVSENVVLTGLENSIVRGMFATTDPDGDELTFSIVNQPKTGNVSVDGTRFTYAPTQADFVGNVSFTFKAIDSTSQESQIATVNIDVQATVAPIAGRVFFDTNGDGVVNPTEPGIANVSVFLTRIDDGGATIGVPFTSVTSEYGEFDFRNILPGKYRLNQRDPIFTNTTVNGPASYDFSIGANDPPITRDFGRAGISSPISETAELNKELQNLSVVSTTDPKGLSVKGLVYGHSDERLRLADWWAFGSGWAGYTNIRISVGRFTEGFEMVEISANQLTPDGVIPVTKTFNRDSRVILINGGLGSVVYLRGSAEDFGLPKGVLTGWAVFGSKADDTLTVDFDSQLFWLNDGAKRRLREVGSIYFDGGTGTNGIKIVGDVTTDIGYNPDSVVPPVFNPRVRPQVPTLANGEGENSTDFLNFGGLDAFGGGGLDFGFAGNDVGLAGISGFIGNVGFATGLSASTHEGAGELFSAGIFIDARNIQPIDFSELRKLTVKPQGVGSQILVSDDFNTTIAGESDLPGTVPAWKVSGSSGGAPFEQAHLFRSQTLIVDTSSLAGDDTITFSAGNGALVNEFSIMTGSGADAVVFDQAVDFAALPFDQIDLGEGINQLKFMAGGNLIDLSSLAEGRLLGVSSIDLRDGSGNRVKLSPAVARAIASSSTTQLELLYNSDAVVEFVDGWKLGEPVVVDGKLISVLESADHSIKVMVENDRPFKNPLLRGDVNGDGKETALDALNIINYMGKLAVSAPPINGQFPLPSLEPGAFFRYLDPVGNGYVSAAGALQIINSIYRRSLSSTLGAEQLSQAAISTQIASPTSPVASRVSAAALNQDMPAILSPKAKLVSRQPDATSTTSTADLAIMEWVQEREDNAFAQIAAMTMLSDDRLVEGE